MKKLLFLLLALCMVLSLCACGSDENEAPETTTAPMESEDPTTSRPEESTTEDKDQGTVYRVTVVDEEGNPIAGAVVQICLDSCYPAVTNAEGVAEYTVEEADYKVSLVSLPEGYTYATEEEAFYFADGSTELTITLKAE